MHFEIGIRYTVTAPDGTISQEGVSQIMQLIAKQRREKGQYYPALPVDFEFVWKNAEGKITRRIANWYFKIHSIKLPQDVIEQIGNIAQAHSTQPQTYNFDFANELDWDAGEFGDRNSCLWGNRENGRYAMQNNGVLAIRFFDESGKGYARAWLYSEDDFYLIWNGYGMTGHSTLEITKIFALFTGLPYKPVVISNNGSTTGSVYINAGNYAIGLNLPEYYDLEISVHDFICHDCERELSQEDAYMGLDECSYCERCFYDHFDTCANCGDTRYYDDTYYIEGNGNVCERCYERDFFRCESCEEDYAITDVCFHDDLYYCPDCFEDLELPIK